MNKEAKRPFASQVRIQCTGSIRLATVNNSITGKWRGSLARTSTLGRPTCSKTIQMVTPYLLPSSGFCDQSSDINLACIVSCGNGPWA